jgi:AraC family transcriptional regulator, regulatory protein of adaptative response / DNA-3-methyladenine glycosylase II
MNKCGTTGQLRVRPFDVRKRVAIQAAAFYSYGMVLDAAACHAAVRSRDARFDGMFYTAVKTTGVYCRPVCPAKTPRAENCTFFETAGAAEAAGFRPCLRCRPELSPAPRIAEENAGVVRLFLAQIQHDGLFDASLEDAAARIGVSSRHLRRAVEQECGVSPLELVLTTRLLFARRLLSTTSLPVSRVAFGSGFGSLARFNHSFRARYGATPTEFRQRTRRADRGGGGIRLTLSWREPYAWEAVIGYLAKRCIPGVEAVRDGRYYRSLRMGDHTGWIAAGRGDSGVEVEISESLATQLLPVAGRVRNLFDLDTNPEVIQSVLAGDPLLRPLVDGLPGLRVPGTCDPFELTVRAILGQQVTVAAASTLAGRLVQRFAEPAEGLPDGLTHWPITAQLLGIAPAGEIAKCGIPLVRAQTLREVARAVDGRKRWAVEDLKGIRGVGPWTLEYVAMRASRRPDAFPESDLGLRRAVGPDIAELAQRWRPWRAYAAMYLWCGTGVAKEKG